MAKTKKKSELESDYKFSDPKTKKRVRKHLSDPKDVITEEDIKNVKVPGEEVQTSKWDNTKTPRPTNSPDKDNSPKEENIDKDPITPWDVLEG